MNVRKLDGRTGEAKWELRFEAPLLGSIGTAGAEEAESRIRAAQQATAKGRGVRSGKVCLWRWCIQAAVFRGKLGYCAG